MYFLNLQEFIAKLLYIYIYIVFFFFFGFEKKTANKSM
jgi:formate/nitrite transporter FocA (FNT family)